MSSSLEPKERSGILKLNCSKDLQTAIEYLGTKKITVAYRDGGLRVSPHAYNTKDEIIVFVEELEKWNKD